MGQKTLEINGIVSKPFDFECMCIIDDERSEGAGAMRSGISALNYLFEGSAITGEALKSIDWEHLITMTRKVYGWYIEELTKAREFEKNQTSPLTKRADD